MQMFTSGMGTQNCPAYIGILKSSNATGSEIGWIYFLGWNWLDKNILDVLSFGTKFPSAVILSTLFNGVSSVLYVYFRIHVHISTSIV